MSDEDALHEAEAKRLTTTTPEQLPCSTCNAERDHRLLATRPAGTVWECCVCATTKLVRGNPLDTVATRPDDVVQVPEPSALEECKRVGMTVRRRPGGDVEIDWPTVYRFVGPEASTAELAIRTHRRVEDGAVLVPVPPDQSPAPPCAHCARSEARVAELERRLAAIRHFVR